MSSRPIPVGRSMRWEKTTNFTMDQSLGDVIVYEGARLKVLNATNQEIEYRVLRNFNRAENR